MLYFNIILRDTAGLLPQSFCRNLCRHLKTLSIQNALRKNQL